MKEELIDLETAKLAKEKGFNEDTKYRFTTDHAVLDLGELMEYPKCHCHPEDDYCECGFCEELKHWSSYIPAPTQSLLQKWLREKHNILVHVNTGYTQEIKNDKLIYSFKPSIQIIEIIGNNLFNSELKYEMFLNLEPMSYDQAFNLGLYEALKMI